MTIITGGIKIVEVANWWPSKLTAEVSLTRFNLPPSVIREREKIRTLTENTEALEKAIDLSRCDALHRQTIARNIARYFGDLVPYQGIERFSRSNNAWFADVKNNSESTCEGVTLTLPGTTSVAIEREGKDVQYLDNVNEVLDIGDLKPKELVKITGWAAGFADEDKLKLVFKTGVGSVTVLKPMGPVWQFWSEQWDGCAVGIFMLLFLATMVAVGVRLRRRQVGRVDTEPQ